MKYYFFRDLEHGGNFRDGCTFHAAGYVETLYCELGKPNYSGKDLAVTYIEPFEGTLVSTWRAISEVELFEVDEWKYLEVIEEYNAIGGLESK